MKSGGKMMVYVAGSLVALTTAQAITSDNPYDRIVERNVFGLKDPPPPPKAPEPPAPPAPEIKLQGINDILGTKQVLFKVKPVKPGEKEQFYVLREGERKDDIKVESIDVKAGSVVFNNNGKPEVKTMENDSEKPSTVAAASGVPMAIPRPAPIMSRGVQQPAANATASRSVPSFARPVRMTTTETAATAPAAVGTSVATGNQGLSLGGTPNQISQSTPQAQEPPLTREEQAALIEIDRQLHADEIARGEYPPLPPTELTPEDAVGMPPPEIPAQPPPVPK